MEPKSWVNLDITNTFPNEGDHFKLVTHNFREGCLGCTENTIVSYFGSLDTTISILTTPGEYARFTYIDVTGGASHTDSVYTTPFETTTYTIVY